MHKDKEKVKTGHEEVEDVDEGFLNLMMKISQKKWSEHERHWCAQHPYYSMDVKPGK